MPSFSHRRTAEYLVADDAGKEYRVGEYTSFITHEASERGEENTREVGKDYVLENGATVKRLGTSLEFEIIRSGVRLRQKS